MSGRYPGEGHGNLLQYFCLENSHGQRRLESYSLWGLKESDMTARLSTAHTFQSSTVCVCVKLLQLCPILCDPMDYSLPASSVHGILQARILEWDAFASPGDLLDPGIQPGSPVLQADSFAI